MEGFLENLMQLTQLKWFKNCVFGDLQERYKLLFSKVLTKHGFCFTFNMQQAESMLNLDKFVIVQNGNFYSVVVFSRVSPDFHYKSDIVINSIVDDAVQSNDSTPYKNMDSVILDFRRYSCDKNSYWGRVDLQKVPDPSVTTYSQSNIFQPVGGILVMLHNPNEYPLNSGHTFWQINWAVTFVSIEPKVFQIDDGLKAKSVEIRHCYLANE